MADAMLLLTRVLHVVAQRCRHEGQLLDGCQPHLLAGPCHAVKLGPATRTNC